MAGAVTLGIRLVARTRPAAGGLDVRGPLVAEAVGLAPPGAVRSRARGFTTRSLSIARLARARLVPALGHEAGVLVEVVRRAQRLPAAMRSMSLHGTRFDS